MTKVADDDNRAASLEGNRSAAGGAVCLESGHDSRSDGCQIRILQNRFCFDESAFNRAHSYVVCAEHLAQAFRPAPFAARSATIKIDSCKTVFRIRMTG